jgi:ribonuclease PH
MLLSSQGERCVMEVEEKPRSKGRSQAEKVGRLKYNQLLLKRALRDLNDVKLMQRTILAGLKGLFHFEKPMV